MTYFNPGLDDLQKEKIELRNPWYRSCTKNAERCRNRTLTMRKQNSSTSGARVKPDWTMISCEFKKKKLEELQNHFEWKCRARKWALEIRSLRNLTEDLTNTCAVLGFDGLQQKRPRFGFEPHRKDQEAQRCRDVSYWWCVVKLEDSSNRPCSRNGAENRGKKCCHEWESIGFGRKENCLNVWLMKWKVANSVISRQWLLRTDWIPTFRFGNRSSKYVKTKNERQSEWMNLNWS